MILASEAQARQYVARLTDGEGLAKLDKLISALRAENERQNLVAAATLESVWQRHIADSAQLLEYVPREARTWVDLGTGAGLPGLIVAMLRPEVAVFMVESRKRRVEWLSSQVASFELANAIVVGTRVEAARAIEADVISARAFAPLPQLIALSARFSTARTCWLLPKGRSAAQEVAQLPIRQRKLFHVEQSLTDAQAGIIVGRGRLEALK